MEDWYYAKNGEQHGPISRTNLADLFKSGELQRSTLVWTSGMEEWKRAPPPPSSDIENESTEKENASQTQQSRDHAAATEQASATSKVASNPGGFFTLKGRANRKKYFLQILIPSFISGFGNVIFSNGSEGAAGLGALLLLAGGLSIFPGVRRLHDINASGWWYLLPPLVPLVGLILLLKKGTDGTNQYGPDPLRKNT